MIKWIRWFFSSTKKPIIEDIDIYGKLIELEKKYDTLSKSVVKLEEENIETSNILYEIMNTADAIDRRIDILITEKLLDDKND